MGRGICARSRSEAHEAARLVDESGGLEVRQCIGCAGQAADLVRQLLHRPRPPAYGQQQIKDGPLRRVSEGAGAGHCARRSDLDLVGSDGGAGGPYELAHPVNQSGTV